MKLLLLGGSRMFARPGNPNSTVGAGRDVPRGPGVPDFQVVPKLSWPNERLPGMVEEWVRDESPDIVLFGINDVWYNYEGVPMRKVRRKGPLGRFINHCWRIASTWPLVSNSRPLHRARRRLANITGATPEFTPEEVIQATASVLRSILRTREDTTVLVLGPFTETDGAYSGKTLARRIERRERVNDGVAAICAGLHIDHIGTHHDALKNRPRTSFLGDGLHTDAAGSKAEALFWRSVLAPYVLREMARRNNREPGGSSATT